MTTFNVSTLPWEILHGKLKVPCQFTPENGLLWINSSEIHVWHAATVVTEAGHNIRFHWFDSVSLWSWTRNGTLLWSNFDTTIDSVSEWLDLETGRHSYAKKSFCCCMWVQLWSLRCELFSVAKVNHMKITSADDGYTLRYANMAVVLFLIWF